MSYLQTIGSDIRSPQDARFAEMVAFIDLHRGLGKSDKEIVALLSRPSFLNPVSHPCSDENGNNLCSAAEITKAMNLSKSVMREVKKEAAKARGESTISPLVIIGGAVVVLFLLSQGRN